jgi:TolA-binding protein
MSMQNVDPVGFRIESKPISPKKTADDSFETVLKTGLKVAVGAVAGGAAIAGPMMPVAAGVSAALSGAVALGESIAASGKGVTGLTAGAAVPGAGLQDGAIPSGNSMVDAMARLQESSQAFSMQYLQLQEQIQQENRQYSTLSNVLKTRHESAKTAINNIR